MLTMLINIISVLLIFIIEKLCRPRSLVWYFQVIGNSLGAWVYFICIVIGFLYRVVLTRCDNYRYQIGLLDYYYCWFIYTTHAIVIIYSLLDGSIR